MGGTFLIIGILNGLSLDFLREMLRSHGLREITREEAFTMTAEKRRVTIVWPSRDEKLRADKAAYNILCDIKMELEQVSYSSIGDKWQLAQNLPDLCARSWDFDKFNVDASGGVYIIRPIGRGCFGGHGIHRIDLNGSTQVIRKKMRMLRAYYRQFSHVVVSEYVMDPLLFEGRKFHFRTYLMFAIGREHRVGDASGVRWSAFGWGTEDTRAMNEPRAKIITAAAKWRASDIDNDDVHDSHAQSTADAYFFPTDCARITHQNGAKITDDEITHIWQTLRTIGERLYTVVAPHLRTYPESSAGITILGLDIMFRDNMQPILIEVNDNVGYKTPFTQTFDRMQRAFFNWAWIDGISHIIGAQP